MIDIAYKLYELCDVCQCVLVLLVALAIWFLHPWRAANGRLLRLGGLLIGCGSTAHSRFATLCALSLSKPHVPLLTFGLKG